MYPQLFSPKTWKKEPAGTARCAPVFNSSDGNISIVDVGSRLGIRGSAEAGEGLTATYVFEHGVNTASTAWGGGRLGNVALSGAFGSLTIGQIWSASFNSFGAVTDNSTWHGASQTRGRHGQVISYAFSNDLMALQLDAAYGDPAVMSGAATNARLEDNPNDDLEVVDFGLSINVGEIGKVALAHTDNKYSVPKAGSASATPAAPAPLATDDIVWGIKTTSIAGQVSVSDLTAYVGTQSAKNSCIGVVPSTTTDPLTACDPANTPAHVNTTNKTTFFGIRGGLGETGINYLFQWRNTKSNDRKPWMLGLYKSLGGGASLNFEHSNPDGGNNTSTMWLRVNF